MTPGLDSKRASFCAAHAPVMNASTLLPSLLLLLGCLAFVFWPQPGGPAPIIEKTRLDYLRERKEVLYENLRDLSFEFRAGKYTEADFDAQRNALEAEAATVLAEIDQLSAVLQKV